MHNDLILTDARYGELGIIHNEEGGAFTEFSITEEISDLGGFVNIPVMVKGQEDLSFIETGELSEENIGIAIARAKERVASGAALPAYRTHNEAIEAAENRTQDEKMEPYVQTEKEAEREEEEQLQTVMSNG